MPRWKPVGEADDEAADESLPAAVANHADVEVSAPNGSPSAGVNELGKQEVTHADLTATDVSIGAANGASAEEHGGKAASGDHAGKGERNRRRRGRGDKDGDDGKGAKGNNGRSSDTADDGVGQNGGSRTKGGKAEKGDRVDDGSKGRKGGSGRKGAAADDGKGGKGGGNKKADKTEKGGQSRGNGKGKGPVGEGKSGAKPKPSRPIGEGEEGRADAEAADESEEPTAAAKTGVAARPRGARRPKNAQGQVHDADAEEAQSPAVPAVDPNDLIRLAQLLKLAEQRADTRTAALTKLKNDIRRLHQEASQERREEALCHEEAQELLSSVGDRCDKHRSKHFEVKAEVDSHAERAHLRRAKEREWREDMEAAAYQRARAKEATDEIAVEASRWRKAAVEQADRVKKAEAKLKALEARRAEHRAQSEKWHRQALVAQKEGVERRAQVQELRLQAQAIEFAAASKKRLWQALAGVLFVFLVALLLQGFTFLR